MITVVWSAVGPPNYIQISLYLFVRNDNLCKPRGPCVCPIITVSFLISSLNSLPTPHKLGSWNLDYGVWEGILSLRTYSMCDSLSRGSPPIKNNRRSPLFWLPDKFYGVFVIPFYQCHCPLLLFLLGTHFQEFIFL